MSSRRSFIRKSALGVAGITMGGIGMSAKSYNKIIGANDRLNVALVGLGRRLGAFPEPISMKESNVQLLYLCDVMQSQRENAAERFSRVLDYTPSLENDVRRIYDDQRVDAIIEATPDHWHTPGTVTPFRPASMFMLKNPAATIPAKERCLWNARKNTAR
jgi:hypothetical protein